MLTKFITLYIEKINKDLDILSEKVCSGLVSDHAHYKFLAGRIKGLNDAKGMIKDIIQSINEKEE